MKHLALLFSTIVLASGICLAQTSAFTYQGRLTDGGTPANGNYDLQFTLWSSLSGGTQIGSTQTASTVFVSDGVFTVPLDFGAGAFPGANRFLEISARLSGGGAFTILAPRQPISSTPYAIRSANATTADTATTATNATNATQLGGVAANQYVVTSDSRLTDSRPPTAGSSNYVQNSTATQASSNFNISGNGTVGGTLTSNISNATRYDINGSRVITEPTISSIFVGRFAGNLTAFSNSNSFFGSFAGSQTTSGGANTFVGAQAAGLNTTGSFNAFFGSGAGGGNTTGRFNTIIGNDANVGSGALEFATALGADAVVSTSNSVVLGRSLDTVQIPGNLNLAGSGTANIFNANTQYNIGGSRVLSTPGFNNTFVGKSAGANNTFGTDANSFFGWSAGTGNTTGENNSFFGTSAGFFNGTGKDNSFFGAFAGASVRNGERNSFFGTQAGGTVDNFGNDNSFIGWFAGALNTIGSNNTFVGASSGASNTAENHNTFVGYISDGAAGITNATAIGSRAKVTQSNSIVLGSINTVNGATADTSVGIGTTAPQQTLHVNGMEILSTGSLSGFKFRNRGSTSPADDWVWYSDGNIARFFRAGVGDLLTITARGVVTINELGSAGGTSLCRNAVNQISDCSSSLRYKTGLQPFTGGLDIINRLRPISFAWKQGGTRDIGLGAEEVEKVEPLLTFRNDKGQIEGVKYNQLSAVFINAFKEQQAQIQQQQERIRQLEQQAGQQRAAFESQQQQLGALKILVCRSHRRATVCR